MKTTYKKIEEFIRASDSFIATYPGETKLNYALKRVIKRAAESMEDYNEKRGDLSIDLASIDDKGNIIHIFNEKTGNICGNAFTPENSKLMNKKVRELYKSNTTIEPHICTELPKDFDEDFREYFEGFVI